MNQYKDHPILGGFFRTRKRPKDLLWHNPLLHSSTKYTSIKLATRMVINQNQI